MVPKAVFPAVLGAALLAGAAASAADYRPDEFLNLDLSKALLSPQRLGPPAEFAPVPIEAKGGVSGVLPQNTDIRKVAVRRVKGAPVRAELKPGSRRENRVAQRQAEKPQAEKLRTERPRAEKPRGSQRVRLVHRRGNPLDARAMDTRIQKWPCNPNSGGICAWR